MYHATLSKCCSPTYNNVAYVTLHNVCRFKLFVGQTNECLLRIQDEVVLTLWSHNVLCEWLRRQRVLTTVPVCVRTCVWYYQVLEN